MCENGTQLCTRDITKMGLPVPRGLGLLIVGLIPLHREKGWDEYLIASYNPS